MLVWYLLAAKLYIFYYTYPADAKRPGLKFSSVYRENLFSNMFYAPKITKLSFSIVGRQTPRTFIDLSAVSLFPRPCLLLLQGANNWTVWSSWRYPNTGHKILVLAVHNELYASAATVKLNTYKNRNKIYIMWLRYVGPRIQDRVLLAFNHCCIFRPAFGCCARQMLVKIVIFSGISNFL